MRTTSRYAGSSTTSIEKSRSYRAAIFHTAGGSHPFFAPAGTSRRHDGPLAGGRDSAVEFGPPAPKLALPRAVLILNRGAGGRVRHASRPRERGRGMPT